MNKITFYISKIFSGINGSLKLKGDKIQAGSVTRSLAGLSSKKTAWSVILIIAALIIIIIFNSGEVSTYPVGWEKGYPITPFDIAVNNMEVTSKGGLIAVVYEGTKKNETGIYISISFDAGKNFLKPVTIDMLRNEINQKPQISISGSGHIAVVWQNISRDDPDSRIFFSVSKNMGASWSAPQRIILPSEMELLPRVIYDDRNTLHVFYNAYMDKSFNIFHIESTDEKTFGQPARLVDITGGLRGAFFPAIHYSGSSFYLVWQGKAAKEDVLNDDLYFIRSDNYGKSWSDSDQLTKGSYNSSSPYLTSNDNDLYLVYKNNEKGNWGIKLLIGHEKGDVWDAVPIDISETNADCYAPVAVIGEKNELIILWYDIRQKTPAVYTRKYTGSPIKIPAEQMLSRSNVTAKKPAAVSMGKQIIVLWEESDRIIAKNSDVHVNPPVVFSRTHPENEWSRSRQVVLEWTPPEDESKIVGYASFIKKSSDEAVQDTSPTVQNINGNTTRIVTPELDDGISYFYIRAIDGAGNFSRTASYKIQISRDPLPMPIVESPTHPDGRGVDSDSPLLQWRIMPSPRLKGFQYSFKKDRAVAPKIFTTDQKIQFSSLDQGRYFFSIRSVDKTNESSRTAIYQVVIGSATALDPSYYDQIANGFETVKKPPVKHIIVKRKVPAIYLEIPFDPGVPFQGDSFDFNITAKNLKQKDIDGYSYYIAKSEQPLPDRINHKEQIIQIKDLTNGEYYIAAKCRYSRIIKGQKKYFWTEPALSKFQVILPEKGAPIVAYMEKILERLNRSWIAVSLSMMTLVFSVVTFGFETRLGFYARLVRLKLSNMFKLF